MPDAPDAVRLDALTDEAIVERVLAGEIDQYASIVERYQHALYRHAVGMVLDHDAACRHGAGRIRPRLYESEGVPRSAPVPGVVVSNASQPLPRLSEGAPSSPSEIR